jgi:phosphate acyltransferase
MENIQIGINVSGGDFGAEVIVPGVNASLLTHNADIVVYGNRNKIYELASGDKPFFAPLQFDMVEAKSPYEELRLAFKDLSNGNISAILTASKSHQLLSVARRYLQEGVHMSALIAPIPTACDIRYLMDVGATADANPPEIFLGWAISGTDYLKKYKGIVDPRIGLYNIASEHGCPRIRAIHEKLKHFPGYTGYAEPKKFFEGEIDLWLSDGFTGNLILKTLEASAPLYLGMAAREIRMYPDAVNIIKEKSNKLLSYDAHLISRLIGVKFPVYRVHGAATSQQISRALQLVACSLTDQSLTH